MKKQRLITFVLAMCMVLGCISVAPDIGSAEEAVVYVNGTLTDAGNGTAETPYNTFAAAVNAIKSTGGTIVVCGKTEISQSSPLGSVSTHIKITSKYGENDYRGDLEDGGELGTVLGGAHIFTTKGSPTDFGVGTGEITLENINVRMAAQYGAFNFRSRRFVLGDGVKIYEPTTNDITQTNTRAATTFQLRYLDIGTNAASYGDLYGKIGKDTSIANLYLGARACVTASNYLADIEGNVTNFFVSDENKSATVDHLIINGDVKVNIGGYIKNVTVSMLSGVSGLREFNGNLLIAMKNGVTEPTINDTLKSAARKWFVVKSTSDSLDVSLGETDSLYTARLTGDYNCVLIKNSSSETVAVANLEGGVGTFSVSDLDSGIYTAEPGVREFYTASFVDSECGNTLEPYKAACDDISALTFNLPTLDNTDTLSFGGWALSENAESAEYAGGASYTLTGNTTFYAVWNERAQLSVTFKDETGKILGTFSGIEGEEITSFPDVPIKGGYKFLFWSADGENPLTVLGTESVTAYPVYEYTGIVSVYLDGSLASNGDGTTPETAYNNFASAMAAVKTDGGMIVVCGATEMTNSGFINTADVVFTSVDPCTGKDYRVGLNAETNEFSGACLMRSQGSPYSMATLTATPGKVYFNNINFLFRSQYSAITARGRTVAMGDEVRFYEPTVNSTSCTTFRAVKAFSFRLYDSSDETSDTVYTANIIGKDTTIPSYQIGTRKDMTLPGHKLTVNGTVGKFIFAGDIKNTDGNHGALTLVGDVDIVVNGTVGSITEATVTVGGETVNGLGTFDGDLRVIVNHTSSFNPETGITSFIRQSAKGVYTLVGSQGVMLDTKTKNGKTVINAEFEDGYNTLTVKNASGETVFERFSLYGGSVDFELPKYGDYTATAGYREVYTVTYTDKTFGLNIPPYAAAADDTASLGITVAKIDNTVTHRFIGWSLTEDGTEPAFVGGEEITLSESMTLYSIWEAIPKYTVSLRAEDETDLGTFTDYPGKTIPFPDMTSYSKYGYRISGWAEKGSTDIIEKVPERDVTLYPVYVERTGEYRVIYLNGSASTNGDGLSPSTAMNSVLSAVALLRNEGGKIVVTGPTVFANSGTKAGCADYPVVTGLSFNNSGDITITSLDEDFGIDYRSTYDSTNKRLDENGAYIFYANGINCGQNTMTGRITYENIVFNKGASTYLNFDGHPFTLGSGIRVYGGTKSTGVTVGKLQLRGLGESSAVKSNPEGLDIETSALEVGSCEFNVGGGASATVNGIKLVLLDSVNYGINLGANSGILTLSGDLRINLYGNPQSFDFAKLSQTSGNVTLIENNSVDAAFDYTAPEGYETKKIMTSGLGNIDFVDGDNDKVSVFCDLGYEYCNVYVNEAQMYDTVRFDKSCVAIVTVPDSRTYTIDYTNDPCFSITFDTGFETPMDRLWNSPTADVTVPDCVHRYGYLFEGWEYGGTVLAPGDIFTMPAKNITFTAVWRVAPMITVSLDSNGYGEDSTVSDYIYEKVTLPVLSDSNAHFIGWATERTAKSGFVNYELTENTTLYAIWESGDNAYSVDVAYSEADNKVYANVFLEGTAANSGIFAFTAGAALKYASGAIVTAHGVTAELTSASKNVSVTWQATEREYDFFTRQLLFTLSFDCKAEDYVPSNIESLVITDGDCSVDNTSCMCRVADVKPNITAFGRIVGTATVVRESAETSKSYAMLYIADTYGSIVYSERLESEGNANRTFGFDVKLPVGSYELSVVKTGYLDKKVKVTVSDGTLTISDQPLFGGDTGNSISMGDGVINAEDFIRIIRGFDPSFTRVKELDINEDGVVNVMDLAGIKQMMMRAVDLSEYSVGTDDIALSDLATELSEMLSERSHITVGVSDSADAKRLIISINGDYKLRNWNTYFDKDNNIRVIGGSSDALIHAFENICDIAIDGGNPTMPANIPKSLTYDSNYEIASATIADTELRNYSIVIPSESDAVAMNAASVIGNYITDKYGYALPVKTDSTPDAYEIHIGNTGFVDYPALEEEHCSIKVNGNKVIVAYNGEYSAEIIAYDFIEQVISKYNPDFDENTFSVAIPDGYELLDNDEVTTKFLVMSDTHVESDFWEKDHEVYTLWKPNFEALTETYKYINDNFPEGSLDFAIFCGDQLNTGYENNQKDLADELANYYETLGVLDLYTNSKGTDLSSFNFRKTEGYKGADGLYKTFPELDSRIIAIQGNHDTGVPDFWRECSFVSGDTKFIGFFASYVGLSAPAGQYRSTGVISDETIAFIEKELQSADDSINHIVLVCHWSIVLDDKNFCWPIYDACAENKYNNNRQRLLELCEQYGADFYINGHEHNGNYPVGKAGPLSDINVGSTTGFWATVEMHKRKAVFDVYTRAYTDAEGNLTKLPVLVKTKSVDLVPRKILLRDANK